MPRNLITSDAALKAAIKARQSNPATAGKLWRVPDGDGLYLLPSLKGGPPAWRLDYSIRGRRKTISLGAYPDTGLALARRKADEARALVSAGVDPSEARKVERQRHAEAMEYERRAAAGEPLPGSFEAVAREWFETKRGGWAPAYGEKIIARLQADVFPHLGTRPVGAITAPELLQVLRRIEARGVIETAHRARENCSQVFRFAVATGRADRDPAQDLRGALKPAHARHFPAITKPERLAELLRAIDGYAGTYVVRTALQLAPLLLLRPGELRHTAWSEVDFEAAVLTVPAARMKRTQAGKRDGSPHLVPLSRQALALLRELHPITGSGSLVFRGERQRDRPMSENTLNAALRALGFAADEVVAHGFRATARTILVERLGVDEAVIEAQLAHSVRDSLGRAYNRTEFVEQRRAMMQRWADYLDRLRDGGNVVRLPGGAAA
jgi:integrase